MNRLSLAAATHWLFFCTISTLIQQCEGRTISEMTRLSSASSALSLLFFTAIFQQCEARTNPSSIMLPNIGPDTDYTVGNTDLDTAVTRSIQYYTITFSALGLFVLFCVICISTAEYFKGRKALRALIVPTYDSESESDEEEEEEIVEKVIMADNSSQYEDITIEEADIVKLKKKLRVKRRKLINTQPLGPLNGSHSVPSLNMSAPMRYSTPIKNTTLEVINYTETNSKGKLSYDESPKKSRGGAGGPHPVGTKVDGDYRGKGTWFSGKIAGSYNDDSGGGGGGELYDVQYDDGELETGVESRRVRVRGLGAITSAGSNQSTTAAASYQSTGHNKEHTIDRNNEQNRGNKDENKGIKAADHWPKEGMVIEGNYNNSGEWFRGKITRMVENGLYEILYDDGDVEIGVALNLIRKAVVQ